MSKRAKRPKRAVENDEYFKFAERILKAAGTRVADGDTVDLAGLVAVRETMEAVEVAAVAKMRAVHGYSWAEIGRDLGMTKQGAQQRYAPKIAALLAEAS